MQNRHLKPYSIAKSAASMPNILTPQNNQSQSTDVHQKEKAPIPLLNEATITSVPLVDESSNDVYLARYRSLEFTTLDQRRKSCDIALRNVVSVKEDTSQQGFKNRFGKLLKGVKAFKKKDRVVQDDGNDFDSTLSNRGRSSQVFRRAFSSFSLKDNYDDEER
jgi:hypothetical protein